MPKGGSVPAPKPFNLAPIALGWLPVPHSLNAGHDLALLRQLEAQSAACFGLPIKRLGDWSRTAHFAEGQDLDFEVTAVVLHAQQVAGPDFPSRLHQLPVRLDPAQFTSPSGERAGFEEARGPQPLVDPDQLILRHR